MNHNLEIVLFIWIFTLTCWHYYHFNTRLWNMTAILKRVVISSWDQLNSCAYIMYDVCARKKKRDTRRWSSLAKLISTLNVTKWVLGKGSLVAFEELISLSHLYVSCVTNGLCKPQFHTFPDRAFDDSWSLPESEASDNEVASVETGFTDPGLISIVYSLQLSSALGILEIKLWGWNLCPLSWSSCRGILVLWRKSYVYSPCQSLCLSVN